MPKQWRDLPCFTYLKEDFAITSYSHRHALVACHSNICNKFHRTWLHHVINRSCQFTHNYFLFYHFRWKSDREECQVVNHCQEFHRQPQYSNSGGPTLPPNGKWGSEVRRFRLMHIETLFIITFIIFWTNMSSLFDRSVTSQVYFKGISKIITVPACNCENSRNNFPLPTAFFPGGSDMNLSHSLSLSPWYRCYFCLKRIQPYT